VWQVTAAVGRLVLRQAPSDLAPPVSVPSNDDGAKTTVAAGPEGRTLVLADAASTGWRATLDGHPLTPTIVDGWAQGFLVPAAGGRLVLSFDRSHRDGWLAVQLVLLMLVLVLAAPSVRADDALGEWLSEDPSEGDSSAVAALESAPDDASQDDVSQDDGAEVGATAPTHADAGLADADTTDGAKGSDSSDGTVGTERTDGTVGTDSSDGADRVDVSAHTVFEVVATDEAVAVPDLSAPGPAEPGPAEPGPAEPGPAEPASSTEPAAPVRRRRAPAKAGTATTPARRRAPRKSSVQEPVEQADQAEEAAARSTATGPGVVEAAAAEDETAGNAAVADAPAVGDPAAADGAAAVNAVVEPAPRQRAPRKRAAAKPAKPTPPDPVEDAPEPVEEGS
jgi:hypothetical protein